MNPCLRHDYEIQSGLIDCNVAISRYLEDHADVPISMAILLALLFTSYLPISS
jgi:hypothetical protein